MSISFWITLWKVTLVAALAFFAAMTVVVSVGSLWDIRRLLQRLRESRADEESP